LWQIAITADFEGYSTAEGGLVSDYDGLNHEISHHFASKNSAPTTSAESARAIPIMTEAHTDRVSDRRRLQERTNAAHTSSGSGSSARNLSGRIGPVRG
jgi:hypothetical protein